LRNGLEVAKCLVIGADMCAMALPFLKQAAVSREAVMQFASMLLNELKSTMYLVGAKDVKALKASRHALTGPLAEWFK
jgi:isopentenyl-diphosphate delta-isomerase